MVGSLRLAYFTLPGAAALDDWFEHFGDIYQWVSLVHDFMACFEFSWYFCCLRVRLKVDKTDLGDRICSVIVLNMNNRQGKTAYTVIFFLYPPCASSRIN